MELLEDLGYAVKRAADADTALAILAETSSPPTSFSPMSSCPA